MLHCAKLHPVSTLCIRIAALKNPATGSQAMFRASLSVMQQDALPGTMRKLAYAHFGIWHEGHCVADLTSLPPQVEDSKVLFQLSSMLSPTNIFLEVAK